MFASKSLEVITKRTYTTRIIWNMYAYGISGTKHSKLSDNKIDFTTYLSPKEQIIYPSHMRVDAMSALAKKIDGMAKKNVR